MNLYQPSWTTLFIETFSSPFHVTLRQSCSRFSRFREDFYQRNRRDAMQETKETIRLTPGWLDTWTTWTYHQKTWCWFLPSRIGDVTDKWVMLPFTHLKVGMLLIKSEIDIGFSWIFAITNSNCRTICDLSNSGFYQQKWEDTKQIQELGIP